jgi:Tripartite tricarboxylate transporter family receptor
MLLLALTACIGSATTALAQNYPAKPIRLIVPYPPGGANDNLARPLVQKLGESMGTQVILDNRGGGGAMIGAELVAKAPPDGYTLLFTSSSLIYNQVINKKVPFNALRDFVPITQMAQTFGYLVLVNPAIGVTTMRELVDLSKKRQVAYGSGGIGNTVDRQPAHQGRAPARDRLYRRQTLRLDARIADDGGSRRAGLRVRTRRPRHLRTGRHAASGRQPHTGCGTQRSAHAENDRALESRRLCAGRQHAGGIPPLSGI